MKPECRLLCQHRRWTVLKICTVVHLHVWWCPCMISYPERQWVIMWITLLGQHFKYFIKPKVFLMGLDFVQTWKAFATIRTTGKDIKVDRHKWTILVKSSHHTKAHRIPFIRLNHNTGRSAAMSSGTQYMLQKNSCTRFAFCFCIWYPGSHNRTKRVWNHVKKFQLETDAGAAEGRHYTGLAQLVFSQCCRVSGSLLSLASPKLSKSTAKLGLKRG